jgi:hypothetical protein
MISVGMFFIYKRVLLQSGILNILPGSLFLAVVFGRCVSILLKVLMLFVYGIVLLQGGTVEIVT